MNNHSIRLIGKSIIQSYSQIFFSDGLLLGFVLLLVSFFNINAGLAGIIAIAASHISAYLIGLNHNKIINGLYGFNSLLVGLGLGIYYSFNWQFLMLIIFASVLTLFITVVMEAILAKYALPFLSMPFLLGIWIVSLASRQYGALEVSEAGIYTYNEMMVLGGNSLLQSHFAFQHFMIPDSLQLYFVSLGAIFFQYNVYAGILIALALLLNSRISFILSLLGFYSAYFYYQFIGANMGELNYGYIGFNFILSAIAIGGFFIIPSFYSFIISVLLIPVLSLLVTGSAGVLEFFQLSTFSLPFNIVVISFLLVLKYRERNFRKPELVVVQQFSPEKNLYANLNYYKRFGSIFNLPIRLPILGKWTINQAHNGKFTHKKDWQHAWDFVIEEQGLEYQNEGGRVEDYYCYNKPIIAPADGEVVEIIDLYEDNKIGNVDLVHNWGNSIVIKHSQYLYSQISHIKAGTFKVHKGQYVNRGEIIAHVGNSGRSPVPHLHFQLQATPYIGSKTMRYPLGPFIRSTQQNFELVQSGIPKLHDLVSNIEVDDNLQKAFKFIAGQEIKWKLEGETSSPIPAFKWIVGVDYLNNLYLHSPNTNSYAYYKITDDELVFTTYKGSKQDPLYWFYLSAFRLLFGYYKGVVIKDDMPVPYSKSRLWKILQDAISPFYIFIKPQFTLEYVSRKKSFDNAELLIKSEFKDVVFGKIYQHIFSEFHCNSDDSMLWKVSVQGKAFTFKRIDE